MRINYTKFVLEFLKAENLASKNPFASRRTVILYRGLSRLSKLHHRSKAELRVSCDAKKSTKAKKKQYSTQRQSKASHPLRYKTNKEWQLAEGHHLKKTFRKNLIAKMIASIQ